MERGGAIGLQDGARGRGDAPECTAAAVMFLRGHHLRVTPQRLLLTEVVHTLPGHFTADEVYDRMRAVYPGVSKVSVYRGLETFRELGLVTCTEFGHHAAEYEWTSTPRHHHVLCTSPVRLQH